MINPLKTGAYIARLRKKRDWTQVELADKLHVTHQAVSRWETGESFPDLGTLAQLAQLFGVRMDSLIDGGQNLFSTDTVRNKVLSELAEGHAEQVAKLVADNPDNVETVIESGPLTRPSLMNRVVEKLSGYPFSLEQVIDLAPFLNQETLDTLAEGLDGPVDRRALVELAPFLSSAQLGRLLDRLKDGGLENKDLIDLAPFLEMEALDQLVLRTLESVKNMEGVEGAIESYQVVALAPFVSQPTLGKLIEWLPEGNMDIEQIIQLAPFVDPKTLSRLIALVPADAIDPQDIVALAPFLDREALAVLIRGQAKA